MVEGNDNERNKWWPTIITLEAKGRRQLHFFLIIALLEKSAGMKGGRHSVWRPSFVTARGSGNGTAMTWPPSTRGGNQVASSTMYAWKKSPEMMWEPSSFQSTWTLDCIRCLCPFQREGFPAASGDKVLGLFFLF